MDESNEEWENSHEEQSEVEEISEEEQSEVEETSEEEQTEMEEAFRELTDQIESNKKTLKQLMKTVLSAIEKCSPTESGVWRTLAICSQVKTTLLVAILDMGEIPQKVEE